MTTPSSAPGLRFVRRIYLPRAIGLGIGFFCVAAALWDSGVPVAVWGLLIFNGFLWPHVAYLIGTRSPKPFEAEMRNLGIDSLMGGYWAATMGFNALPSVLILAMKCMNNVAAGGLRFFAVGLALQALGMGISILSLGFKFTPETSPFQVYACLPMLLIYPLALGWVSYRLAMQLSEKKKQLRAMSQTDSLTLLHNHGYWEEVLEREFERCRRSERCATLALIDIDHFKHINDSSGHLAGDAVLRQLSNMMRQHLRVFDVAGRYGGDEFCILLLDTPVAQAREVLERIREQAHRLRFDLAPNVQVTLSVGLAGFNKGLAEASEWLAQADKALYQAKSEGRDRISIYQVPAPVQWAGTGQSETRPETR